ncbi:Arylformamidase [Lentibacillus sp. JNUCC-1]|uniref:cyclase family protein n=1 Tax=Lentibacillus sp. JNUCC-1 TaxID=2654513 RepID=UPI0012E80E26|nr:cyclase family protein [Lentibacillus sp. JNUCC-1]MUV37331.1 Arylformamidase [Lentibacillus sp. JNUCC-1]
MEIYDVSAPIFEGMPVYKNKPEKQPKIETVTNGHVTESRISMDLHSGTHVDAPLHMINDGNTFETIDIERLVGKVKLFDVTHIEEAITQDDIEGFGIERGDFVLFKTKNSFDEEFNFDFIYVAEDAAQFLADVGVKGIGIDSLGIERAQPDHPTHRILFKREVLIMEGLRFAEVEEGEYFMVAAPLRIEGTDASPARVLLMDGVSVH